MQKYAENAAKKQMHKIQQDFNKHWSGQDPWRDENGDLVPGFIEGIAERQPFYKRLVQKYHNQPDSVLYYINKPHKVRLFDYEKGEIRKGNVVYGFYSLYGAFYALLYDCNGT